MKLIKVKTKKGELLPKQEMTISEFNAISSFFSGADFERNSTLPMSMLATSGLLWFI